MLSAQNTNRPYWEVAQDTSANFYDIKAAFENYWAGKTIERGKGWKVFKRWEDFVAPRVYPSGDLHQLRNTAIIQQQMHQAGAFRNAAGNWSYIGNSTVPNGGGAGRINAIAFHPTDPNIIYVGAPAGGLWRSTNGGQSWICTTDELPTLAVSAITFNPLNPNIVYMGTGDQDGGDQWGLGIYKSYDGGLTWNTTGLSFANNVDVPVNKILIHPVDTNIIIASTANGIYKSWNSGQSWTLTSGTLHRDIEFKPNDPSVVYAARNGRFYRSTDTASTFTQITSGLGSSSVMARINIGVSPANPNYVYLLVSDVGQGFYAIYRSTDAGLNFTLRTDSPNILGWDANGGDTGGQGNYDLALAVDRNNAEIIFTGGVNIWRSTNGGSSMTCVAHWYGAQGLPYVHADIHTLEYNPHNNKLYAGCDGGVFVREANVNTWTDLSSNLHVAQIYRMGGSPTNSTIIISGWQDNGTNLSTPNYRQVLGGDGMEALVSWNNPSTMYGEYYYGDIYKSTNGGNNFSNVVGSGGTGVDEDGEWVTPFVQHPTNANTLLVGKSQLWKSTNAGTSWSQVGSIGSGQTKINAIAYAPSNPNYIYVSKTNKFYVTTNGSAFTDRTSGLPGSAAIQYIAVSNQDPEKVWVCLSGFSNNQKVYYSANAGQTWTNYSQGLPNIPTNTIVYQNNSNDALYLGTDLGVYYRDNSSGAWVLFSGGLPNGIVRELEIHYLSGKIRAAMYGRGIWESDLYSYVINDIRISDVHYPTNEVCGSHFSPEIVLTNSSDQNLYSAVISYNVDNGTPAVYNWNGILAPQSNLEITLPALPVVAGAHTFRVWTSLPNNTNDSDPFNDTLTIPFTGIVNAVHTELNLQLDCFGEETSWQLKNGATVLYEKTPGDYPGNVNNWIDGGTHVTEHFCLSANCYTLTMNDTEGNGLNGMADGCDINGSYQLTDPSGNVLVQNANSNGNYGSTVTHNFCIASTYYASFSAPEPEICAGNAVQFSDLSQSGTNTWNWSFPGGNPSSSTLQNPVVMYPNAGTYSVTLTAGNGTSTSTITQNAIVHVNPEVAITYSSNNMLCHAACNGNIKATIISGTSPYEYSWSNAAITDSIYSLCAGNYDLFVRDAKGCFANTSIQITEPDELILSSNFTNANCGIQDGTASVNITGGTGAYAILWSDSSTTNAISNLDIGTYTVSVTDENGCVKNDFVVIENPNAPLVNASGTNETCGGDCDGSINASASGGTGNLVLQWNNSLGNNNSYSDLCSGMYIVTVTDDNNCAHRDTVVVNAGYPYPTASFILNDSIVGVGQSVSFINMSSSQVTNFYWDFGDGGSSTFSSTTHSYADTGSYVITNILSNHSCTDTLSFTILVMDATGIREIYNDQFNLYPNPTFDRVTVDFGNLNIEGQLEILNSNGQLMERIPLNGRVKLDIAMNKYSDGIYLFRVKYADHYLIRKLILQR